VSSVFHPLRRGGSRRRHAVPARSVKGSYRQHNDPGPSTANFDPLNVPEYFLNQGKFEFCCYANDNANAYPSPLFLNALRVAIFIEIDFHSLPSSPG
jgi:hypothetical protein